MKDLTLVVCLTLIITAVLTYMPSPKEYSFTPSPSQLSGR